MKHKLFIAIGMLISVILSAGFNFMEHGLNTIELLPLHKVVFALAGLWLLVMLIMTLKNRTLEGHFKAILICLYLWVAILGLTAFSNAILTFFLHLLGLALASISFFYSLKKRAS